MSALSRRPTLPLLLALLGSWLAVRAFANPVDHDIDQYVGGAMLAADGLRPFVDFIHLQTPLQIPLWSPVVAAAGRAAFPVLHLVTILCGLATVAVTYAAARRHGAAAGGALAAVLLMALAEPFQYSATTLRNDATAALFGTLGMAAALWGVRSARPLPPLLAGLFWGLAASTKLSYLVVATFGGGALLWLAARGQVRARVFGFAVLGAVAGLLPSLSAAIAAPDAFGWGVYRYASEAPFAWNEANGRADRLTLLDKPLNALRILAEGPALIAILLLAAGRALRRGPPDAEVRLLDMLIVGGIVAGLMPTPVQRGYFLPLLPPLFVRLAPCLAPWVRHRKRIPVALLAFGAFVGLVRLPVLATLAAIRGVPAVAVQREGDWIGRTMRAEGTRGPIATLSPRLVLASGEPLDPRFATGVFVFRTGWLLSGDRAHAFNAATPATLRGMLDAAPPAAIVTGYEAGRGRFPLAPDTALVRYARDRGWTAHRSPYGRATLYLAPARTER